ncbi:LysR family transcriptional regulator [Mesorhizobium sp. B4-1-4]|uniref:LysR family transcriptional regulator n=1 Tax=Mesorhizobium sp. B4-1-4 TaxID=2589888 RepID=UPI001D026C56|nr:LysR family transcriptional regulator [Mesorhizobium sp. B4-1-4]UCI31830.1 LysR family transcriptional regulator [Mesorhizobium sp. B4-1-4]
MKQSREAEAFDPRRNITPNVMRLGISHTQTAQKAGVLNERLERSDDFAASLAAPTIRGAGIVDFRRLRYFLGVVEARSFTKAAERLHVAQSALSLHIRQMEEGFGTSLLVRDRTGVTPTIAGYKLAHHARAILQRVTLAEEELTNAAKSPSGEITIGISCGVARMMVSRILALAREQLPMVSIKIVEGMSGPIEEWLAQGRFSLAILESTVENQDAAILAREEFCLVVPPNKPPFENTVRLSDLQKFPLAIPVRANSIGHSVTNLIARHGCALDVRFEIDSLSTIIDMVTDGKVCSILTPSAIQREASLGQLRCVKIVDPAISRTVVLAANPREERSALLGAARALVSQVVKDLALEATEAKATPEDVEAQIATIAPHRPPARREHNVLMYQQDRV